MKILTNRYYWLSLVVLQVVLHVMFGSMVAMGLNVTFAAIVSTVFGAAGWLWMYSGISEMRTAK